jgi:hypothetical protein
MKENIYSLHESSPVVSPKMGRSIRNVVAMPTLDGPLMPRRSSLDALGSQVFSVIRDGAIFRMWYLAWPEHADGKENQVTLCYAQSNNGYDWQLPHQNQVQYGGSKANNLVSLPFLSPSVFIDTQAPASHRYRVTGFCNPKFNIGDEPCTLSEAGYYTAHSSDGTQWQLDSRSPRWQGRDVITSCWDPYNNRGYISLKNIRRFGGMSRRIFHDAHFVEGEYRNDYLSLVPDEYDDFRAKQVGGIAGDYYGMGWAPAPNTTFGLLWTFHVDAPITLTTSPHYDPIGLYGRTELTLVWRDRPYDKWSHIPGRPSIFTTGDPTTWYGGGLYSASHTLAVGDEEWMYVTGTSVWHGDYLDSNWKSDPERLKIVRRVGLADTGVLRWKKGRLLGLAAPLYDELQLDLPNIGEHDALFLNMRTWHGGCVRAELRDPKTKDVFKGCSREECYPISGDELRAQVRWKTKSALPNPVARPYIIRLCLDSAAVYTVETAPASGAK